MDANYFISNITLYHTLTSLTYSYFGKMNFRDTGIFDFPNLNDIQANLEATLKKYIHIYLLSKAFSNKYLDAHRYALNIAQASVDVGQ